jgi:hypothetical protein
MSLFGSAAARWSDHQPDLGEIRAKQFLPSGAATLHLS